MKKATLTILSLAFTLIGFSQTDNDQGAVTYEELIKLDIQIDNMTPEMQAMMPKENRNTTILYFNEDVSRYENLELPDDGLIEEETEGGSVKVMISQPETIVHRDLKNKTILEQKEFMTRVFLIESDDPKEDWKLSGNQKMILDFPCQEAMKIKDGDSVSVWFTPAIPVSSGPGQYANLPGLVLAVEADHGNRTIVAKSVDLREIDPDKIQAPKKGKKVTRDEYLAIVEEKTREMGGDGSSEGAHTVIMKISK